MTTDQVNVLGARLVAADADGDAEKFHDTAYALLEAAAAEHDLAARLAARIDTLARKAGAVA